LTSATNLELSAYDPRADSVVEWQVVEYTDSAVQSGDVSFASGDSTKTVTGLSAFATDKAWLIYSYKSDTGTTSNIGQKLVRGLVSSSTSLLFDRDQTGQALDLTWHLVEFQDDTAVQHANASFSSAQTQTDVPITAVDPTESIAVGGYMLRGGKSPYSSDDHAGVAWFSAELTSGTNLRLRRDFTGSSTADLGWSVIEFDANALCPGGTVTTTTDSITTGTLRACVIWANGNPGADTITVPAGTYTLTLGNSGEDDAAEGDLDITETLTIIGAGARTTIIDGNANDRIFHVPANVGSLTLSDMTLRNGNADGNDGGAILNSDNTVTLTDVTLTGNSAAGKKGGAIYVASGDAQLNVNRATFTNNSAAEGGAIYGTGGGTRLQITNATFNANTATSKGGALHVNHLAIVNVTIVGNTASVGEGGGVNESGGEVFSSINSIIANNTGGDCISTIDSGNNNIDSDTTCGFATVADPLLGALANNGGPTDTMMPQAGSPAIEGGDGTFAPVLDQRSVSRPQGALWDVGAVEVVLTQLSGAVFEDADFAGTASDYDGGTNDLALPNVDVELYTSADAYVYSTTTDASGNFSFGVVDGSYKVRVRSATIGDSNTLPDGGFNAACGITDPVSGVACAVAEQTWGNGAAAIGGQSATIDDTATDNDAGPGDTWVSVTVSGSDVAGVNFGFAYNPIVNSNNSGQGSLRQFIDNANKIGSANGTTANYSEFRIDTAGVALISPTTALPAITDTGTTIDGTTQTDNVGDTNTGAFGTGGTVGVDGLALSQVAAPEVEIRDAGGLAIGLHVQANNATIRGVAMLGFGTANPEGAIVVADGFTGTLVEQNILGSTATSFTDPGAVLRNYTGVTSNGGDNGTIQDNLIGFGHRGIFLLNSSSTWTVEGNEIKDHDLADADGDGIAVDGSTNITLLGNLITGSSSQGLSATNSSGTNLVNNTLTGNGVGSTTTVAQSAAITMRSTASNTTIDRNIIQANYGAGIQVNDGATGTVITRNSIAGNGTIAARSTATLTGQIGIDLNVAGNDSDLGTPNYFSINSQIDTLQDFPILEKAVISGGSLILEGWSKPLASIEVFIAAADPFGFGEGETYVGTFVEGTADGDADVTLYGPGVINGLAQGTDTANRFSFTVPIASLAAPVVVTDQLSATATLSGETSEFSGLVTVAPAIADLTLTMTDNPDPTAVNGPLLYTLLVSNAGPQTATGVTVTDTLPASMTLVSATPNQGSCPGVGPITCDLGSIANGGTATIEILVTTTATGTFTNNASVTANEVEPTPADNAASEDTDVVLVTTVNDVPLTQFTRLHGFIDHVVTGGSLRTGNTSGTHCDIAASSSQNLSGIPATATVRAAYLYWGASGLAVDNAVTFDGAPTFASRTYEADYTAGSKVYEFYAGFAEVTAQVTAKGNGLYTFADLAVDNGDPWCSGREVMGGWSLFVVYDDPGISAKTLVLYDGFDLDRNTGQDYLLSGIFAAPPPEAKTTVLVWNGDAGLGTGGEALQFNGNILSDALNPANNPYNSTINSLGVTDSYAMDLDTFDTSAFVNSGDTLATTRVGTGPDLVILNAVVLQVKTSIIAGTVFEDVNYGGGAGRDLATAAADAPAFTVPRPGAIVELYDSGGVFLRTTVTDASGIYSFQGLVSGNYTVRVVNDSVSSSRPGATGSEWPVQTFRTDAAGASAVDVTNEVGGADPTAQDDPANGGALNLAAITAQSLAPVTLSAAETKSSVDFGYNFDTIVNTNDSGQGSLREFIDAANTLANTNLAQDGQTAGDEVSIFMIPAGQLTAGVAVITPVTALPPITGANGANTVIDGTTQTTGIGNNNSGSLGAGGTVGLGADGVAGTADEPSLSQVAAPEVEINSSNTVRTGLDVQANSVTIRGISIHGFGQNLDEAIDGNIRVGLDGTTDYTGVLIEGNVIGATATSFASPATPTDGDGIIVRGADSGTVRNNLLGFNYRSGIKAHDDVTGWLIENNEFRSNGTTTRYGDAIDIAYITSGTTVSGNLLIDNGASGVDTYESNGSNTITNNTISGNGFAGQANQETSGIRLFGTDNDVTQNLIQNNFGAGVLVMGDGAALNQRSLRNRITRNAFLGNGSNAIDLLAVGSDQNFGDGITINDGAANDCGYLTTSGNDGLDYPVISSVSYAVGTTTIVGQACPSSDIEW
jgi:uncharacterized repeat protein (TIGR01451 family)